jgi:hypothetical protein
MSLAIYAAPFDNDTDVNTTKDITNIERKKQQHNRTQKRIPPSEKVNSLLEKLHNNQYNEDNNLLGDYISPQENIISSFNPPPKPQSIGSNRTVIKENMTTLGGSSGQPQPNSEKDNLELNNINTNYTATEYYKKMIPNFNENNVNLGVNSPHNVGSNYKNVANDVLLQKLNYMIHLLEEQQDEKTNNVTEEVVLYSFLGIFIIFVCDSFARVSKYVR